MLQSGCDRERNKENETALQTPRWKKVEGEEVLQAPEQRFPYNSWRNHGGEKVFPRSSQRYHIEENTTLHPVETPCCSRWMCPEGSCSPWRSHAGANFWQEQQSVEQSPYTAFLAGSVACGGPVLQQDILGGLHHMQRTLFLTRNKLIFPKSNMFCPWQINDFSVLKILSFLFIFSQFSAEEGGEGTAWWAPGRQPRLTDHRFIQEKKSELKCTKMYVGLVFCICRVHVSTSFWSSSCAVNE